MKSIMLIAMFLIGIATLPAKEVKRPDSYNYMRGMEALNEGKTDEATEYFRKEIEANPKNGYAYSWLGSILGSNEEYGAALSSLNKALKLVPSADKTFVVATLNMRADVNVALADTVRALEDLALAIKTDSQNGDTYEKRGQLLYELHRYADSDADYDMLIKLDDGNTTGYMGKARNANTQHKYDEALTLLNHVVSLAKDYGQAYTFRAESRLGLKNYNEAVDDIIMALSLNDEKAGYLLVNLDEEAYPIMEVKVKVQMKKESSNPYWPYRLAQLLESKGRYMDAIEQYLAANKIDAHPTLLKRTSSCYESMGDYNTALEYLDKAITMAPEDDELKLMKAEQYGEAGMINECLAEFQGIIDRNPDFAGAYYRKGHFEDNSNMTDSAIEDYTMSIVLDPSYAYAYLGRGDMYVRKGQQEKAVADYLKVIELDTIPNDNACAMYAFLALGRKDEAISFMENVIANDTTDCGVHYDGACFYSRLGDYDKALDNFRLCLEKGFRRFSHIEKDDDLDAIRERPEFKELVDKYKAMVCEPRNEQEEKTETEVVEIPFTKENGVTKVKCEINSLPLHFIFDTGASDVTLSLVEANFMLKNDYISEKDIIGNKRYIDANGDISVGTVINLKNVTFGGLELENVRASVVRNQKAPLLLGQSVLGRLGKVEIDNPAMKLKITHSAKK